MNINPFKKAKKEAFDITQICSRVEKPSGGVEITQIVHATVIEVGDDEASDGFSYKYSFINPITNAECEGFDLLQEILEGELLYDVGDKVDILFISHGEDGKNFEVNRQIIFPEISNKKMKVRKIIRIIYTICTIIAFILCCFTVGERMPQQTNETEQTEQLEQTEETKNTNKNE